MNGCGYVCFRCIDSCEVITLNFRRSVTIITAILCLITLILDTRTGITGASLGIDICIKTLIPSLFPFLILSTLLNSYLLGDHSIRLLRPLGRLCRIPVGSESLLLMGFLGGYPSGAQNVEHGRREQLISVSDARRMVVICNNAGPAFIFGFLGQLFEDPRYPWILWIVHIFSALLTGYLLPGGTKDGLVALNSRSIPLSVSLNRSIRTMASICGWVIIFRIIQEFLSRWILWAIPFPVRILLCGFLELTNGCLELQNLSSDGAKLLLSAFLLGFGGICVFLQTQSIAGSLSLQYYLPGKFLHGCISFLFAYGVQVLFLPDQAFHISPFIPLAVLLPILLYGSISRKIEKSIAISPDLLYNRKSCEKRRTICFFVKRSQNPAPTAFSAPN